MKIRKMLKRKMARVVRWNMWTPKSSLWRKLAP
jgi:hypothetical protein